MTENTTAKPASTLAQTSELLGYIVAQPVKTEAYMHSRKHTMEDGSILKDTRRQQPFGKLYGGLTAL